MHKTLKLAKTVVIFLSVVFSMLLIENQVVANADETARIETVNIVDTQGNTLKKQQTQTLDGDPQGLGVKVPGYDPAKTLSEIQLITVSPEEIKTEVVFKVDNDKNAIGVSGTVGGKPQDPYYISIDQVADQVGIPVASISSVSDALVKLIDFAKYGIYFDTPGSIENIQSNLMIDITVTYAYQQATTPIQFIDSNGKVVGNDTIPGFLGKTGDYTPKAPDGYQLVDTEPIAYTMSEKENPVLTIHVVKKSVTPDIPSDNHPTNVTPETPVTPAPTTPTGETTQRPAEPTIPNYAAKKGAAVYATRAIYLYKKANFKPSQRLAKYPKVKRVNRPMFVVTDYARSTNGALRYKVRDVNHGSKTAGKVGYITANSKFVVPVYYQSVPKSQKLTIINKRGVNAYRNVNLTQKVKHYRKGTHLTVKKIVKYRLTTRYQLSNGDYVTANKKLVIQKDIK